MVFFFSYCSCLSTQLSTFLRNIKTKYHGWLKVVSLFILYFIFKNDPKKLYLLYVCTIFNIKTESFFFCHSIVKPYHVSCLSRVVYSSWYSWYRQIQINFYFMMYLYFMKSLNSFFNIFSSTCLFKHTHRNTLQRRRCWFTSAHTDDKE